MNRLQPFWPSGWIRPSRIGVVLFAVMAAQLAGREAHAEPPARPNVLFIAADDLNDWTGFLNGHPGRERRTSTGWLAGASPSPGPTVRPRRAIPRGRVS